MRPPYDIPPERLAAWCRERKITRLAVFGSALRSDFGPSSDLDVLVEFEPGRTPGLAFFRMQEELSSLFGRTVDLHTPADLGKLRPTVMAEAKTLYVAA